MIYRLVKTGRSYAVKNDTSLPDGFTEMSKPEFSFNYLDKIIHDKDDCLMQLVLTEADLILTKSQITGNDTVDRTIHELTTLLQKRVAFLKRRLATTIKQF